MPPTQRDKLMEAVAATKARLRSAGLLPQDTGQQQQQQQQGQQGQQAGTQGGERSGTLVASRLREPSPHQGQLQGEQRQQQTDASGSKAVAIDSTALAGAPARDAAGGAPRATSSRAL